MILNWSEVISSVKKIHSTGNGTVCAYVYDLNALNKHAINIRASLPINYDFFYAIKANSDLPILSTLAKLVDGFEVSSGGEILWVREHFPKIPLIFSGPGKLDLELALAIEHDVTVHVESQHELERLANLVRTSKKLTSVLLRINPQLEELNTTSLVMGGKPTQFGISTENLLACLGFLRSEQFLALKGFHFHLLSHQLEANRHLLLISAYIKQSRAWCEQFNLTIDQINVGGGIGVNYCVPEDQFDWTTFSDGLNNLVGKELYLSNKKFNPRIRFEFGRFVSAFCGYYATEVIDIKKSSGVVFAVLRGGTHHFRTPYAQGHSHPLKILSIDSWDKPYSRPNIRSCSVNLVGQLCTPKDILASNVMVDELRVGDIVLFSHAGAYAWHISHHDFLRHPHPEHIYLPIVEESRPP